VRLNAKQRRRLAGIYLIVIEGHGVPKTRFLPLLDASKLATPLLQREGARVMELLGEGDPISSSQTASLMERFKTHKRIVSLNPTELLFAALIVAMDA